MTEKKDDEVIHFESGVSQRTGEPFIHMHWGENHGQLNPQEAMEHAFNVMRTVEASYSDAFLVAFLTEKLDVPTEKALPILMEFRAYRAALAERGV